MTRSGGAARTAVYERGLGLCDRCGEHLGAADGPWHAHHRQLRSQGGTWALSNIAALCGPCHTHVHAHPTESYADGWLVGSYADPPEIPVCFQSSWANGAWCRLDDAGSWTPLAVIA